ncbi:flagellar assembly protein FliH [Aquibacillus saliphilus]|uniref:flagellar assembly protein FliH n=1 Tax=Aquibacillus saliphilus TaxID=1909422 RepID=UPI001CF09AF1
MSNVLKLNQSHQKNKIIGIKPIQGNQAQSTLNEEQEYDEDQHLQEQLRDAKSQLENVELRAQEIIESAHKQVEIDKEQWKDEKEKLVQQATESGYNDGYVLGKQESVTKYNTLIDEARSIVDIAQADYHSTIEKSEDAVLQLALSAASKILHVEIEETDNFINLVKHVIKEMKEQSAVTIYSHPEDYRLILTFKEELVNIISSKVELSIYPDTALNRGSCIVETPYGKTDASIDSQLQELRNKLFDFSQEEDREHSRIP